MAAGEDTDAPERAPLMERRALVAALGLGLVVPALPAAAQQTGKIPRIGYLFSFAPAEGQHLWEACRQGLRDLGYVEGRDIVLDPRWADGQHDRLRALAAELVRARVDVLVAAATPASQAAKAATATTPIVIVAVGEPVKVGLVASLARPGGNVTGLSLLTPELAGKRLQLLAEVVRQIPRVAALMNPGNRVHEVFLEETRAAARSLGVHLQPLEARTAEDLEGAFAAATTGRASALLVFDDPVLWSHRKRIVALAGARRLPVMYGYREFVDDGGLMSYGPDRVEHYRRTALYVDKILRGARPADLPVEQPTKFQLVVNLKTARALGLTVPQALLLQADTVLE